MEYDRWRQWQAFAAGAAPSFTPGVAPGFAAGAGAAPAGAFGFAPFIDAAERFAAATRSFHDGTAGGSAPAAAAAAQVFGNFLRDQFADSFKVSGVGQLWGAAPSGGAEQPLPAELPALGLTREHQERAQRAAQAWRAMDDAQRRLQRLWSDTLREAASAFVARLGAAQSAPLTPETLNRLYDSWIDCAEESYARTAHSESFCDALADYVNASSQLRRESKAGAEFWAKVLDLPTRNEVNTLAQRLRALEERVRAQAEPAQVEARRSTAPRPEARSSASRPSASRPSDSRPSDSRKSRSAPRKPRPPRKSKP
jgi:hypothetical protein